MAILSIRGLYRYDKTLFDGMTLPDGMDKDVLIHQLIAELAELEILYTDPVYMKAIITSWAKANYSVWDRAWNALQIEYNPLWNVDGSVVETENRDLTRAGTSSGTSGNTRTDNLQQVHENKVAGFNSTDYQNREQNTTRDTGTQQDAGSHSDTHSDRDTGTITRTTRRTGNIGVTTSQQMLKEELELAKVNIYSWIIEMFKGRFCVMVY